MKRLDKRFQLTKVSKVRTKLTTERIAELDKFAIRKEYEFVWTGMAMQLIPFDPNFRVRRMVRVKKSGN